MWRSVRPLQRPALQHFKCSEMIKLCNGITRLTATDIVCQDVIIIRVVVHVDDSARLNRFVFIVKLIQYSYSGNYLHFVQVVLTREVTVLFAGLIKSWSCCSTMSQLCVDCLFANMWCWNVIANSSFPV